MTSDGGLPAESDAGLKGVMGGRTDDDDDSDANKSGPGCSWLALSVIVLGALLLLR